MYSDILVILGGYGGSAGGGGRNELFEVFINKLSPFFLHMVICNFVWYIVTFAWYISTLSGGAILVGFVF